MQSQPYKLFSKFSKSQDEFVMRFNVEDLEKILLPPVFDLPDMENVVENFEEIKKHGNTKVTVWITYEYQTKPVSFSCSFLEYNENYEGDDEDLIDGDIGEMTSSQMKQFLEICENTIPNIKMVLGSTYMCRGFT